MTRRDRGRTRQRIKGKSKVPAKVIVKVPEQQAPFVVLPGPSGGVFVSLLWNWGDELKVPMDQLAAVLSSAKPGSVVIARRLTPAEMKRFHAARGDADHELQASLVPNDQARWRPPGRR